MSDVKSLDINGVSYGIKAQSVVDKGGGKLEYWTGTKAQYEAIATKDNKTYYTCTDTGEIYLGDTQLGGGSGYEVGDIVIRNTPTNDAGKHLLDGALIQYGSYRAFVDYIADLYNSAPTEDVYNVNIVGSLTNNNGVLSGFAGGVYATIKEVPYSTADSIEILLKTTTGTLDTSNYKCFYSPVISDKRGVNLQINPSNQIMLYVSSNAGSSWDIVNAVAGTTTLQSDTQYYFKYVYTGTNHILYMSTTGAFAGEETTEVNVTNSGKPSNSTVSLGLQAWSTNQNNYYWRGSIDLNESYININGQRWWSGKTEKRAGFLTEEEWQQTVTTYGSCGKFVYDSVNNTVRLPKVSDILQGTTDLTAIGDLVEAGLPNITGESQLTVTGDAAIGATGAGAIRTGHHATNIGVQEVSKSGRQLGGPWNFDASRSNSIYGNSSTVQPQTIKVLYYIVIANSTKTDIQVDIDQIATDLNGKADVDGTNIVSNFSTSLVNNMSDTANIYMSGMSMPSDTAVTLSVGASGTQYTAPANGWFGFSCTVSNSGFIGLYSQNLGISSQHTGGNDVYMPVKKNKNVQISYGGNVSRFSLRFVYAQGSESEAN